MPIVGKLLSKAAQEAFDKLPSKIIPIVEKEVIPFAQKGFGVLSKYAQDVFDKLPSKIKPITKTIEQSVSKDIPLVSKEIPGLSKPIVKEVVDDKKMFDEIIPNIKKAM